VASAAGRISRAMAITAAIRIAVPVAENQSNLYTAS
jgi:hypothetical protein